MVEVNTVAANYSRDSGRIIEYRFGDGTGGLISFHDHRVELYRTDPGIQIVTGTPDSDTMIEDLYSKINSDGDRDVLDGLLIRAGYRWRCGVDTTIVTCGWMNTAGDNACGGCGTAR